MVPPTTRQGRWSYYPSEVTANAFVDWAEEHGAQLLFMQSGKPNQNAFVERFNGSVSPKRHECDLGLQNMNQSKHEGARMKSIHTLLVVLGLSFGLVGHADSREWYVSASASLGGDGSIQAPFNTLAAVQQASGPGDTIFVVPSPIQNAPLDGGIALKPGQRLIGAGPPVVGAAAPVPIKGPGLPIQSAGPLAVALATLPQITNTSTANNSGDAVTLANGTEVANLVISGTQRGGIYGLNVGGVNVHGNDISMANLSCTVGFTVQPQNIGTYIPGSGVFNPGGVPTAWAAILIDATQGAMPVTIANNYVHDGVCNNGIDVRAMGTSQIYAKVIGNGVFRLTQPASKSGVHAVSMQALDTATLTAFINNSTSADLGNANANPEGFFGNTAGSGVLNLTYDHVAALNMIGGASSNGAEYLMSTGGGAQHIEMHNGVFRINPGDTLQFLNGAPDGQMSILLDNVLVDGTTLRTGLPSYATPPGTNTSASNQGNCLFARQIGGGGRTDLTIRNSAFSNCDRAGVEVLNNSAFFGAGTFTSMSVDVDSTTITGSRYYNLWFSNLTSLGQLTVRVQNSNLSTSNSGVAVGVSQPLPASTGSVTIDMGGGTLGSVGQNCIYGGAIYDMQTMGYNVAAEHNWWGSAAGPAPGKVVANAGFAIDASSPLAAAPSTCGSGSATSLLE